MRLRRVTLRDFRGVSDRTVELPESGTTVIVGDNEIGKSSLIEALVLLFDLPDDSRALRIRAVQPVGRDVGPEVAADLTLGAVRLEYRKRWLRSRVTELAVTEADGSRTGYTGREAHDQAARLFEQHVDPVLWQTLMVGQGNALVLPAPADAEPLIAAVTAESGTPLDGSSMPLVAAVEQEYLRYWTRGGRPTGDFARSGVALAQAEGRADQLRQAVDAVADDVRRAERLAQDLVELAERLGAHAEAVGQLENQSREADALLVRRDAVVARADLMRARLENCTRVRTDRDRLLADLDHWSAETAELTALRTDAADRAHRVLAAARHAEAASATAAEERDALQQAARRAERAVARLTDRAELARLIARHDELRSVRARAAAAKAALEALAVTDELVAALDEAHADVVAARAALAAGAPSIRVRRLGTAEVKLSNRDPLSDTRVAGAEADADLVDAGLSEGESAELIVDGELRIVVPAQLEVTVQAGGEVAALRLAAESAARRERELLVRCGVAGLAEARDLLRRRDTATAELAEARRSEKSLTSTGDPAEQIALLTARLAADGGEVTTETADNRSAAVPTGGATAVPGESPAGAFAGDGGDRLDGACGEGDGGSHHSVSVDEVVAAQQELDRARSALVAADLTLTDAEFVASQARKAGDEERSAGQQLSARLELAADRLAAATEAIAAARAAASDEQVLADEDAAAAEVEAVLIELTSLQELVDESGAGQLPGRLADAREVLSQLRSEHDGLRDSLRRTEGRLEQSGQDGIASQLAAAELDLERVRSEHDRLRRRADAALRVHDTLSRHRAAAQARYAEPLRSRIEALGRSVYGPTFQVALDDDLTVAERELNGIRLGVDALSTGAREQLAIITRLAIAHLVGKGAGSVPAIIDDALGWSDKGRLREMGALLGRAGDHGQVIVLTCMPERYEYVPGAKVIRLDPR